MARRDVVKLSALTPALALLGCGGSSQGNGKPRAPESPSARTAPEVAVVGAGLAGVHCAARLLEAGVDVTVYEASDRIGGRTFTGQNLFPEGQVCELGGELIDSNHRTMFALVEELGLEMDDRFVGDYANAARDTWFIAGRRVQEAEIEQQFSQVVGALASAVEAADADDVEFERLDATPLSDFLAGVVPAAAYPELHAVLAAAYVGEFGLELADQSALNLVYLIGTESAHPFRVFGDSDERYHIRGGNDQVATRLAERLEGRVQLGHQLEAATSSPNGIELTFATAQGAMRREFGRVVFALPFTKLRGVNTDGLSLSKEKRTVIRDLGYGTNAKVMGAFDQRVWLKQGQSGSVTSDLPLQQTWDSSIGQPGAHGILTNFLGGRGGETSSAGSAEDWYQSILPDLDTIFPGARAAYVKGSAVRMHWPTHKFTLGSYACYRPGQWAYWGTEGVPEGSAHFCGEHTSPEYQGWMEGAAESGARVAVEILNAHGIALPATLRSLIDEETSLPDHPLLSSRFPKRLRRLYEREMVARAAQHAQLGEREGVHRQ